MVTMNPQLSKSSANIACEYAARHLASYFHGNTLLLSGGCVFVWLIAYFCPFWNGGDIIYASWFLDLTIRPFNSDEVPHNK